MILCTIVMTYMISVAGGPWECRVKNLDRDTALDMRAAFNNKEFLDTIKSQGASVKNLKFQTFEQPFNCNEANIKLDDKHNGCLGSTNQEPSTGFADTN